MVYLLDFLLNDNIFVNVEAFKSYLFMFYTMLDYAGKFCVIFLEHLLLTFIIRNIILEILGWP